MKGVNGVSDNEKKQQGVKVKVELDNSDFVTALDEIEKRLDAMQEKANQLKSTLDECRI